MKKKLKHLCLGILGVTIALLSIGAGKAIYARLVAPTPPPAVSIPAPITREDLLNETNKHRETPLVLDPVLNDSAQAKCADMATRDDWSHGDPWKFIPNDRNYRGENLAYGIDTATAVVEGWVNSSTHYGNLVKKEYTNVGFGLCPFRDSTLVVQHFSDSPQ